MANETEHAASSAPMSRPGEVAGWPKLVVTYQTDPAKLGALLPPGITPGAEPTVQVGIYCVPVKGEPEYGVSTKVRARWDRMDGWYSLGMGIDQESAIFISGELNGQPKFPCEVHYYRLGDHVAARCIHQGYTFFEFAGDVKGELKPDGEDIETNEWWTKYSRAIGGVEGAYDYPPHVVRVRTVSRPVHIEELSGTARFLESPWDPYTTLLPMEEQISAQLVTSKHSARDITNAGPLDPAAFWPYADVIGGSRWPGTAGGPRSAD